ncbi:MAG TPA: cupin domain-containing protein [Gaiellaceae bacterium]|nr:cupin domain-containing protein [Gaiellaceae bacterium]
MSSLAAVDLQAALTAALEPMGPRAGATRGAPFESKRVLHRGFRTEIGVWEVTEGTFPARKDGTCELMQFIAGRGTITDENGVTRIEPGVVMFTPDGWSGIWDVEEPIRKTYAVNETRIRLRGLARALWLTLKEKRRR